MSRVHDMGGQHGFGPLAIESGEPPLHHEWEARVFALNRFMLRTGRYTRRVCALEYYDANLRASVDSGEQILEAFKYTGVEYVERRIVKYDLPVRRCILDDANVRCRFNHD
jgi:Nitrile hydratase beta subunit